MNILHITQPTFLLKIRQITLISFFSQPSLSFNIRRLDKSEQFSLKNLTD